MNNVNGNCLTETAYSFRFVLRNQMHNYRTRSLDQYHLFFCNERNKTSLYLFDLSLTCADDNNYYYCGFVTYFINTRTVAYLRCHRVANKMAAKTMFSDVMCHSLMDYGLH